METLYYTATPQIFEADGIITGGTGWKDINLYTIDTQAMNLVLIAEIEAPYGNNSEAEIQAWMDEDEFWGADTYDFEQL